MDALSRSAEILLIGVMPFLYGAATRLPFIYFVIHLSQHFGLDMLNIGFCVASYQFSRVVTSALSTKVSRVSHLLGTSIGLAGFLTVYIADTNSIVPFVLGTVAVGFSETMSSLQIYAKVAYEAETDRAKANLKLKYQYASVMTGVVFAFSVGGFVYQYFNINGVALFGAIIEFLALLAAVVFLAFSPKKEAGAANTLGDDECSDTHSSDAEEAQPGLSKKLTLLMIDADSTYVGDNSFPITWVNWIMCISFGIEALTIGYNLSIGPIFMLEEFNRQTGILGIMFAVGAASGTVAAIGVTCTPFGRDALKRVASSPFDICFAMAGIALGVLVASIPSFGAHVFGVILLMCFNDLGATLMTELQASITTTSNYSLVGPLGQVVRRSLNVITALTGPVLFGVLPRLPYLVAGGVTLIWTALLFVALKRRATNTVEKIKQVTRRNTGSVIRRVPFMLSETMRALVKRKKEEEVDERNEP